MRQDFEEVYRAEIAHAIVKRKLDRQPWWTESIAVGNQGFIRKVKDQTRYRRHLDTSEVAEGVWVVREAVTRYSLRQK